MAKSQREKEEEKGPVQIWLKELRLSAEMECMTVLQSKSLLQEGTFTFGGKTIKAAVDSIRTEADSIGCEFKELFKCVESESWSLFQDLTVDVTCNIRYLIKECNRQILDPPVHFVDQQEVVMGECAKLVQRVESLSEPESTKSPKVPLVNQLVYLGQSFSQLVDYALGLLVQMLIQALDAAVDRHTLTAAIKDIINLGLEGDHMCYVIAREGGVRGLFDVCNSPKLYRVRAWSLKAIATISCVPESIHELEKVGGLECLADILAERSQGEEIRGEAAGVVAQITSPYLDQHIPVMIGFIENMNDLLKSLIELCHETSSSEVFLLASAAIANITFMDNNACDILLYHKAPSILTKACILNKARSVFSKDQVVSILANMAALESCQEAITENHGIELLIEFLTENPVSQRTEIEVSACERVLQKSAIALTRLSRGVKNAHIIAESYGIPRLIKLCRNPKKRNNSDAVLVACLAALRKVCSICGNHDMSKQDVQQLIKPRLMDSFLICTHGDENFV